LYVSVICNYMGAAIFSYRTHFSRRRICMTHAPTDTYSWIGTSGGSWGSGPNWADVTVGGAPAGTQPSGQNPVLVSGPNGSVYEVIRGGGSAAEILQTGLAALSGSYAVGGVLSVGAPASTPGSLLLETGSVLQAGSVALNTGTITLDGASLGVSGAMTAGSATVGAGSGVVNLGAGASLTVAGGLALGNGSLVVGGAGARVVLGALSLGSAPMIAGSGGSSSPHDLGSLSVGSGATVTVAGSVTEPDGVIAVSGTQALLVVGETLTLQGGPTGSPAFRWTRSVAGRFGSVGWRSRRSGRTRWWPRSMLTVCRRWRSAHLVVQRRVP
jgi:hypothetical protein